MNQENVQSFLELGTRQFDKLRDNNVQLDKDYEAS